MNFDRFTARMEQIHMKASATREELALAEMLGKLVAAYDAPAMNRALSKTSPIDMVRHLMEQKFTPGGSAARVRLPRRRIECTNRQARQSRYLVASLAPRLSFP